MKTFEDRQLLSNIFDTSHLRKQISLLHEIWSAEKNIWNVILTGYGHNQKSLEQQCMGPHSRHIQSTGYRLMDRRGQNPYKGNNATNPYQLTSASLSSRNPCIFRLNRNFHKSVMCNPGSRELMTFSSPYPVLLAARSRQSVVCR